MSDPEPGLAARREHVCRCGSKISPGDRIVYSRGRPIHVACVDKVEAD